MYAHRIAAAIAVVLAVPLANPLLAAAPTTATPSPVVQTAGAYLGVMLGPVPEGLRAQLGSVLPSGQGVMIEDVVEGSPAAKAGLQAYDILLSYGDQKLFSAEQLSRLVHADSARRSVTLQLVRNGTTSERKVVLGEAQADDTTYARRGMPWLPRQHQYRHPMGPYYAQPSAGATDNWETFDSLSLQKREDGSYRAEIQYLDANGELEKRQFTGSRDEIRDQLMRQKDLPPVERDQLLDALSARGDFAPMAPPFGRHLRPPPWLNWQPGF